MLKGLRVASKGLITQVVKNDIIANNLANASTAGFKRELARFSRETAGTDNSLRELVISSSTDFGRGYVRRTGNPMDLAIEGDGFFVVETPDGERYTRAGSFSLNERGELVTAGGFRVLSTSGPVVVDLEEGRLEIANDGTVSVGGISKSALRIVRFRDVSRLERQGGNLFMAGREAGQEDLDQARVNVLTGFLEGSNVNPLEEIVNMISALRTYQAIEKSVKASDEVLDTMINRIGRVPEGGS